MSRLQTLAILLLLAPIVTSCGGEIPDEGVGDDSAEALRRRTLTVRTIDLDHGGAELRGMWTTISRNGSVVQTGFTPLAVSLSTGTYSVTVSNYENFLFNRWDNGSASAQRTLSLSSSMTVTASYDSDGIPSGAGGSGNTTTRAYTGSTETFLNPERGFFTGINLTSGSGYGQVRTSGFSLAHVSVQLDAYRNSALPQSLLDSLTAGFGRVRAAGIKIVLRFRYNNPSSYPSSDPDAPKSIVLSHISQLAPVLRANGDVIANMDGGFIGLWGEWHGSTNGLDSIANKRDIVFAILDALPPNRMVTARTPDAKSGIFGTSSPLNDTTGFSGTHQARVGHLNDCFLSSATDYGTYPSPVETWKSYVAQDAHYVPQGGETCAVYDPLTSCSAATAEMARMHTSQLNSQYNTSVLNQWRSGGCFADIERRLGYRFALVEASHTKAVAPGGVLELTVRLRNDGFAALYNPRPLYVVLASGGTVLRAPITTVDPRRWRSGSPSSFTVRMRVPATLAAGTYRVALWLPDEAQALRSNAAYSVRFANGSVWDATSGWNVLTTELPIDPAATGSVDSNANAFVQVP